MVSSITAATTIARPLFGRLFIDYAEPVGFSQQVLQHIELAGPPPRKDPTSDFFDPQCKGAIGYRVSANQHDSNSTTIATKGHGPEDIALFNWLMHPDGAFTSYHIRSNLTSLNKKEAFSYWENKHSVS